SHLQGGRIDGTHEATAQTRRPLANDAAARAAAERALGNGLRLGQLGRCEPVPVVAPRIMSVPWFNGFRGKRAVDVGGGRSGRRPWPPTRARSIARAFRRRARCAVAGGCSPASTTRSARVRRRAW